MTRKGKKKQTSSGSQQQQPSSQQLQQPSASQQQQPSASQQQQPSASQQQQPSASQQQRPPAWQQQRPPASQQQRPSASQQQQPSASQQQQPSASQQQRPPASQQQRPSAWRQQQPSGSQQQQSTTSKHDKQQWQQPCVLQQERPRMPQQQVPHGPQQQPPVIQQQRPCMPQQQVPPGPQQQQQGLHAAREQQQGVVAPQPSSSQQQLPVVQQPLAPIGGAPQVSDSQKSKQELQSKQIKLPIDTVMSSVSMKGGNGKSTMSSALQESYAQLIPKRTNPQGGTVGRKILVETNMFRIMFSPNFQTHVVHYDVVITPDKPKFLMRAIFEGYRKKHFPNRFPAFDGKKNAYSAKVLPFGDTSIEDDITVFDNERQQNRTFKIYLKKAADLDLSWLKSTNLAQLTHEKEQKGLQALDIIFQHGPAYQFISVGRSIFQEPEPGRVVSLSGGLDLWVGVFKAAVIGWKPYLNVDVAHKGFPTPQSVINLMKELCQDSRSRVPLQTLTMADVARNRDKITKFLKGLKIQYEIPGQSATKRTYRVNGLVECPRKNMFSPNDGAKCSVEQYFSEIKKYKVRFPELPCLWVGSRNNNIHLPAELCTIVGGQVTQKGMDENQTSKMVKEAATDTRKRKAKIMAGFASMRLNEHPALTNEFHLSVQGEFERVPARVLPAPALQYDETQVKVSRGVWRVGNFLKPSRLQEGSWTILNLDRFVKDYDLRENLHNNLLQGGRNVNMTIGKAQTPFTTLSISGRDISHILEYFEKKKEQNIQLVVVVIPHIEDAYSRVKQICELKVTGGIVTQCIKARTLGKMSEATVTNILLKINSKLNGINHTLVQRPPCLKVPCMLVGADVTHPSPDATDIPSIAAVAASHDPSAFKYNIELRLQSPREEMIQDLEEIMRSQLMFFYRKTGYKPEKIIFYRDGVSDGQLPQVMHHELSAIKRAIARLESSGQHKIPVTFLVVQKRHHIRLFPTDQRNSDDRNFNVQAGTVVDTDITHPTHVDFYLVSHASIQGTARPTKYRCICNENNQSDDEIEQLTYYLCHMFARCTRSVSYPAPTYYAHLAAFRARALIRNVPLNLHDLQEAQRRNMTLQLNRNSPMFFV